MSEIVRKTLDEEPAIVVVDSAKMLRDFADERELRGALYDLTSRIAQTGTVLLLVGEYTPEELRSGIEFSLADGIIQLEYEAREPVDRRWLRITKMRGGSHRSGKHTFQIGPGGIEVFPRIETLIPHRVAPVSGRIPSGIPGLDELMSGGARQGDATLVTGPSGVGKTIFGLRWLTQGLEQGERCLYVTFQDTPDQLAGVAADFGWDLEAARAAGQLVDLLRPDGRSGPRRPGHRRALGTRPSTRSAASSSTAWPSWPSPPARRNASPPTCAASSDSIRAAGSSLLVTSETTAHGLAATVAGRAACSCSTTSSTCATSKKDPR